MPSTATRGVTRPRRGLDALLDVVETLQALPLAASILEREILPARLERYQPSDLDALISAGEVVWCGVEPLGERDGRVALFLTDHLLAFEITSIVLLVAAVGGVVLGMRPERRPGEPEAQP